MSHYEVVRQIRYWAVRRIGPKGGIRIIAVYANEGEANTVAAYLNLYADSEV
jgi:hypothetical protein